MDKCIVLVVNVFVYLVGGFVFLRPVDLSQIKWYLRSKPQSFHWLSNSSLCSHVEVTYMNEPVMLWSFMHRYPHFGGTYHHHL
jgi:hypothetical protein